MKVFAILTLALLTTRATATDIKAGEFCSESACSCVDPSQKLASAMCDSSQKCVEGETHMDCLMIMDKEDSLKCKFDLCVCPGPEGSGKDAICKVNEFCSFSDEPFCFTGVDIHEICRQEKCKCAEDPTVEVPMDHICYSRNEKVEAGILLKEGQSCLNYMTNCLCVASSSSGINSGEPTPVGKTCLKQSGENILADGIRLMPGMMCPKDSTVECRCSDDTTYDADVVKGEIIKPSFFCMVDPVQDKYMETQDLAKTEDPVAPNTMLVCGAISHNGNKGIGKLIPSGMSCFTDGKDFAIHDPSKVLKHWHICYEKENCACKYAGGTKICLDGEVCTDNGVDDTTCHLPAKTKNFVCEKEQCQCSDGISYRICGKDEVCLTDDEVDCGFELSEKGQCDGGSCVCKEYDKKAYFKFELCKDGYYCMHGDKNADSGVQDMYCIDDLYDGQDLRRTKNNLLGRLLAI